MLCKQYMAYVLGTSDWRSDVCSSDHSHPGAFTPTCTTEQCPAFERFYEDFKAAGVDEVYCVSVNDAFVMYQWGKHLGIKNVKLLPDGSGDFTRRMGMLIKKNHLGFGERSWQIGRAHV